MANTKDKNDPTNTSAAYDVMAERIDLVSSLMGGTKVMQEKGRTYLPQYPAETDKNYNMRLERSTLYNHFRHTVESLVGKPFSNPIVLGDDMPSQLKVMSEDVDHQGNSIDVFGRKLFQDALVKGLTHFLVEYPNTANQAIATKEDEAVVNASPYFVHVPNETLLAAYCEYRNGQEFLTHVRILEVEVERDGFQERTVTRVRVLEPGIWQLWEKRDKKWAMVDNGTTSLDFIPLVTYYADREDFMIAYPPLTDLAYTNLAHYQSNSDQVNVLSVSRFPMLALSGATGEEGATEIGPKRLLTTADKDAKYYYIEHTGAAIEAGRMHLQDLQDQMGNLGVELLKKSGNTTATAKAIDSAASMSMLQSMVMTFSDALEQGYAIAARWMGLGQGGSVTINSDFGIPLDNPNDEQTLTEARKEKQISRVAYLSELKRRKTLADTFDIEKDKVQLDAEKQEAIEDAALQMTLVQEGVLPDPNPEPNKTGDKKATPKQTTEE